jgi:hypothetical protein
VENLRPDQRDFLRAIGGLLLTAGAIVLFIRKSTNDSWGDFALLLVLLVPCVSLYALGLGVFDRELARGARPAINRGLLVTGKRVAPAWQSVLLVLAVILVPLVLLQFLEVLGGSSDDSLNAAWIFTVTAALALYAAFAAGVNYSALLGALSIIVVWLSLWDKILDGPSATTIRWLLLALAAGFVLAAVQLDRMDLRQGVDFVTGAGIAAVAAGVLGLVALGVQYVGRSLAEAFGSASAVSGVRQHQEWDVLLLLVGVALAWYGSRRSARGPTYVGAIALLAFVISVGVQLVKLFGGDQADGAFVGWPLLLLVLGGVALLAGFAQTRPRPVNAAPPPQPPQPA